MSLEADELAYLRAENLTLTKQRSRHTERIRELEREIHILRHGYDRALVRDAFIGDLRRRIASLEERQQTLMRLSARLLKEGQRNDQLHPDGHPDPEHPVVQ